MGPKIEPPWLEAAYGEMGVAEQPGELHNSRIIEYHSKTTYKATSDEVPWCASFVCWCLDQAKILSTSSARALDFLNWGQAIEHPVKGCITILSRGTDKGHVGFYVGGDLNNVSLLGGNQSNQVRITIFPKTRVLGYRWPLISDVKKMDRHTEKDPVFS